MSLINTSLPASGSTNWYSHYSAHDADTRFMLGLVRPLSSFSGADNSAKFRQACTDVASMNPKPLVAIPAGATLDAGTTPFSMPTGMGIIGTLGTETEFGYMCPVNIRHTGSSTSGVFNFPSGSAGQTMKGLCFLGTASTRAFTDKPFDVSQGAWEYVTFDNVSFNQFDSIYQGPQTGFRWLGQVFLNNFSCNREVLYLTGSDGILWPEGGFLECGNIGTYSNAATLTAIVRFGALAKNPVGPLYVTGSPSTPFRLDGGDGGMHFMGTVCEGRPNPGAGPRFLWCAGELMRLTGGRSVIRNSWHGYAMRDPAATGRSPGGFYHITGGDHVIDGGTFQPYPAANYPSFTYPNGGTHTGGTIPPFVWISGGHVRITNITKGPNAASNPVVRYPTASPSFVDADSSVTLTAF